MSTADDQTRASLAREAMSALTAWGITSEDQVALLGLPSETRGRMLNRFRAGMGFPDDPDCLARLENIVAIHHAVHSLHPHSSEAANYWVTTPLFAFGNRTALEVMLADGLKGMQQLIHHLNGTGDWY